MSIYDLAYLISESVSVYGRYVIGLSSRLSVGCRLRFQHGAKLKRLPCHEQHKETHVCQNDWQLHHNGHWFLFQQRSQIQHTLPNSSIPCWVWSNKFVIYTGHALHLHSTFVTLRALWSAGTVEHLFWVPFNGFNNDMSVRQPSLFSDKTFISPTSGAM